MIANAQKRGLLDAMAVFYMIRASLRHSTQICPRTKVKRPAVGSRKHAQGPEFAGFFCSFAPQARFLKALQEFLGVSWLF